jgi:hypothetical protein
MMLYNILRNVHDGEKEQQDTEKARGKLDGRGLKRLLDAGFCLLVMLGGFFMMGIGALIFELFQNLFLRSNVAHFRPGRGLELHVSELLWTGSKGSPHLDRFYCSSEDISCSNLFSEVFQIS